MTELRRNTGRTLAALALALTAVAGVSGAAQAARDDPPGGPTTGCPNGAVCVYPGAGWNGGHPTYVFYTYATHKIYNQEGVHRVYNNQTGGAGSTLCENGNGSSCFLFVRARTYDDINLSPINSIRLYP